MLRVRGGIHTLPSRKEAEALLCEAEERNPGPWGDHSRVAARCAEAIAARCNGMDKEKAYILGLLHDIGRRFGKGHMRHIADGYAYMRSLRFDEAARVCLTHSFCTGTTDDYIGKRDVTDEELHTIQAALEHIEFDDYDRLIQLCDSLAGAEGVMRMEDRMEDVRRRYGGYPQAKWDQNFALKTYFEDKMGAELYSVFNKTVSC